MEVTVKDVPEVDQGQSTFESQPKDSRADRSWTGTGIVADSEQSAFESNPAGSKADLLETEKSLAAVLLSATVKQEQLRACDRTFAQELKTFADTAHVLGSETSAVDGHTYPLFQVCSFTGVHPTVNLKAFDVVTMMRRLTQREHSAALSQLASRISPVMKCGQGAGEDPLAQVKELITESIDELQSETSSEAKHKSYRDDELTG